MMKGYSGSAEASIVRFFHPSDLSGGELDLDPMRVKRGFREDPLDDTLGEISCALIGLLHDRDVLSDSDVLSLSAVHYRCLPQSA